MVEQLITQKKRNNRWLVSLILVMNVTMTELAYSFVKYLDEENLNYLFRVLQPSLELKVVNYWLDIDTFKTSDNILQKKSFKVLVHMIDTHPSFLDTSISEITKIV